MSQDVFVAERRAALNCKGYKAVLATLFMRERSDAVRSGCLSQFGFL
jgi:hypothetical protein